ncbi:MAG TPA: MMPL family transporter [Atribacteraceae bacterium]|nr:MMPL family transporter [Atribacteraceae bacterium]
MTKFVQLIVRYSKIILIATIVLILWAGFSLRNLRFEDDFTKYVPEHNPEVAFFNSLEDVFAGFQRKSMIVALEFDDLFTPESLATVQNMVTAVEGLSEVKNVHALTNMPQVLTTEFGIEVRDIVEVLPQTLAEARDLREDLEEDELIWGRMVTEDGRATILMVAFYYEVDEYAAIERVIEVCDPLAGNAQITYFGLPIIQRESSLDAQRNMMNLTPLATLALLVILYLGFRSIQGVLLPVFIAGFASLVTIGIAAALGEPLSMISAMLPIMLLALVSAYGIHFINRYYEDCGRLEGSQAAENTLRNIFFPIALSALTTMGGFLSLLTAEIKPISDFGLFSSLGILFGFVFATFSLGAFYTVFALKRPPRQFIQQEGKKGDALYRLLSGISRLVTGRKRAVLVVIIALLIFLGFGIPRISMEMSMETQLGEDHPITRLLDYFEERFGGTSINYLHLTTDSIRHPQVLREMVRISRYANRFNAFQDASSVAGLVMDLNEAIEGWRALPDTRDKVDNLWFFVADNSYVQDQISADESRVLINFRAAETSSQLLEEEIIAFRQFLAERPRRFRMAPVEEEQARNALVETIVQDLAIFGLNPPDQNRLAAIVREVLEEPVESFYGEDPIFAREITRYVLLEIEDLGLTAEEVVDALLAYYRENENRTLAGVLTSELDLSADDAWYLEDTLHFASERVAASRKVAALRDRVAEMTGHEFDDTYDFVFFQILDEVVYIPDDNGDLVIDYRVTGSSIINNYITGKLFDQQSQSIVLAFVVVFGLLLLQLRSWRRAIIAMTPIALTVFASFGLMGHFRIPLNVATLMVASIAIGAGVDYTIHFLTRWYAEQNKRPSEAIHIAITRTGRGIFLNAVAVAGGIYVMAASSIHMLRVFGALMATVLLLSVVFTMFLLPMILQAEEKIFKNSFKNKGGTTV